MTVHYFSPGPARLPEEVRTKIHAELLDTFGIGVSILEISHRSNQYERLNEETLQLAREVFCVPNTHEVLFSVCGAQQHFSLLIQHLSAPNDEIAYTDTGIWAHLACQEAFASGRKVHMVYNGGPDYKTLGVPQNWSVPTNSKFIHLTVNNTVYGTEYKAIPTFGNTPLVLDMTSSLAARNDIPWEKTALVYASAQKNFGIAGVSVVIIKKDFLEQSKQLTNLDHVGRALTYSALLEAKSALNTPPVMSIFCMNKMLHWIKQTGGIAVMEDWALQKANLIYKHFDDEFYIGRAERQYRSRHNFVFNLSTPEKDAHFIQAAAKQHILEIKGYKSLGGLRVSMYNGVSLESAKVMSEFMSHYKKKFG
ncbi:MAG: 3-phosphoserine/phosphohydroxythreonine transaminase [Bdellovibrionota bacterium]